MADDEKAHCNGLKIVQLDEERVEHEHLFILVLSTIIPLEVDLPRKHVVVLFQQEGKLRDDPTLNFNGEVSSTSDHLISVDKDLTANRATIDLHSKNTVFEASW